MSILYLQKDRIDRKNCPVNKHTTANQQHDKNLIIKLSYLMRFVQVFRRDIVVLYFITINTIVQLNSYWTTNFMSFKNLNTDHIKA